MNSNINQNRRNNPNKVEEKKSIFAPNKLVAIVFYLLGILLLGTVFIIICGAIAGSVSGAGSGRIIELIMDSSKLDTMTNLETNAYYSAQGFGNALTYIFMAIGVIFFMRDEFINDFNSLKENKKFYAIYIPCAAILFAGLAIVISIIFGKIAGSSENQNTIELMMKYSGAAPMIFATILLAPVVEESIFRKCIFYYGRNIPVWISYAVSALLFTLPHMLSSDISNFGNWALLCIPYLLDALLLCTVYHLSKKNIYSVICAHMLNNIIAVILVFI
ncbi:MAG: CPBP family intramembrane metalloprotease [Acholeplasmatales bacterium]|nr:CPBP family intramembrane metalloprotease [Acholeplasmatales bacterium]